MNSPLRPPAIRLSIAAVERDTGLSKDTLRVWERRYGFPAPVRDSMDERSYPVDQVEKLRLLKRLLDAGHRPGRVVPMPMAELTALADVIQPAPQHGPGGKAGAAPQDLRPVLEVIRQHDAPGLRRHLSQSLARLGVSRFVNEWIAPLNLAVGDAWMRGQLEIFEEHLYTEAVQVVLRQAIAQMPEPTRASRPRVLLTTVPGEPHGLGLLMAETLLSLEACACVSLGVQTPLWDTIRAARAHGSDIVALGFTACLGPNQVVDALVELRAKLPAETDVWAGGTAPVLLRRHVEGVRPFVTLESIPEAVRAWRQAKGLGLESAA